jgi:hypothetical protein
MTEPPTLIAIACVIAFAINLVPAFMPSTWMVLAFFYLRFDLPLFPLTVSGAVASGAGRYFLARGSGALKHRFFQRRASDIDALGDVLARHRNYVVVIVFLYALLLPLPTNTLFVAAGLAGVPLLWMVAGFWAARMIADTFWVWTASAAFDTLGDLFAGAVTSWPAALLQAAGIGLIVVFYRLPWGKWLERYTGRAAKAVAGGTESSRPGPHGAGSRRQARK